MRKLLIIILIIILLTAFGVMLTSGISIGNLEIASIQKIIDNNRNLDEKIAELQATINTEWKSAESDLATSLKSAQTSKQKYQDTITYSTEDEIKSANQTEKYKIGYLWTKIGLYATKNNVTMQANVSASNVQEQYNISFTARGEYLDISEFVYAIENDSSLGFKIEDFTLVPYSEDKLQATFAIKNVSIDKESLSAAGVITQTQTITNSSDNQNTNDESQETTVQ